jgi:hypothetical protein
MGKDEEWRGNRMFKECFGEKDGVRWLRVEKKGADGEWTIGIERGYSIGGLRFVIKSGDFCVSDWMETVNCEC